MNEEKVWYTSKGVIFPLVSAGMAVLAGFGIDFGLGPEEVTQTVLAIGSAVFAALGSYGRIVAKSKITATK